MKKMILAAAMTLTAASAFAQYNSCDAEMIDNRGRVREVIRAFDCQEAMKQCRVRINDLRMRGVYDCRRIENTGPIPGPQNPYPYPDTNPYPGPQTGYDARRMLNNGETVIKDNQYVTVLGYNGYYAVRSTDGWNRVTNSVARELLSVTSGCNLRLCTGDSVIDVSYAQYVKVVGISFDETFVTQSTDGYNRLTSRMRRENLADTKGCVSTGYTKLCVGNTVIDRMNREGVVVGIQPDGKVVTRSTDGWNRLTTRVESRDLVVIR